MDNHYPNLKSEKAQIWRIGYQAAQMEFSRETGQNRPVENAA